MLSSPRLSLSPNSLKLHSFSSIYIKSNGISDFFSKKLIHRSLKIYGQQKSSNSFAPLPKIVHERITEENLKDGRIILVGDVHGCVDELLDLLKLSGYKKKDNVILLGDLINKGPKSLQVIRIAQEMGFYAVRGNHDDLILNAFDSSKNIKNNGKLDWIKDMTNNDYNWLQNLPLSLQIPSHNALIVHGGLLPDMRLICQSPIHLLNLRFIKPKPILSFSSDEVSVEEERSKLRLVRKLEVQRASRWQDCSEKDKNSVLWGKVWMGPMHVFFGHDAARGLQLYRHATGLDTGCVYGGFLTACILPPVYKIRQKRRMEKGKKNGYEVDKPLGGNLVAVPAWKRYCDVKIQD